MHNWLKNNIKTILLITVNTLATALLIFSLTWVNMKNSQNTAKNESDIRIKNLESLLSDKDSFIDDTKPAQGLVRVTELVSKSTINNLGCCDTASYSIYAKNGEESSSISGYVFVVQDVSEDQITISSSKLFYSEGDEVGKKSLIVLKSGVKLIISSRNTNSIGEFMSTIKPGEVIESVQFEFVFEKL